MRKPQLPDARRLSASVSIAAAVAALTAGSAIAAGTGDGPISISPIPSLPSGFGAVVIAKTLTNKGGAVIGGGVGGQVRVIVPRGAAGKSLGVAIIHGSVATVRAEVPTSLRDDKILADFGVELQHGSSPATARKPVTVNFGAPSIRRGEVLVAYDPKTGGFVPVPATFTISLGNVAITTNSSVSLALLEPNK